MKFRQKFGSFVILTRSNRKEIFLVKRSDLPVWEPQGGGIEDNENPKTTAMREAYEETGFKIKILRKVAEYKELNSNKTSTYVFEGSYIKGVFKPEYEGCEGRWFDIKKLPKRMTGSKKMMIEDCLKHNDKLIYRPEASFLCAQNIYLLFAIPWDLSKFVYNKYKLFLLISIIYLQ